MTKIFIYNSSRNIESRPHRYIAKLVEHLETGYSENLTIYNNSPLNTHLLPHDGDASFYKTGINKMDEKDDCHRLKKELLDSDLIVLATPVYCHNPSSDMCIFIERIASLWVHLFKLAGKACVIITTSESNGHEKVSEQVENIFTTMGAAILHKAHFVNSFDNSTEAMEGVHEAVSTFFSGYTVKSNLELEASFRSYKQIFSDYPVDHFEYKYWKESGLFQAQSFQHYLDRIKSAQPD